MNILFGGNRKWQNHYLKNWATDTKGKALYNTVFDCTRRKRTAHRHMGTAAFGLSEAVPKGYIYQSSYNRQAQHLSCRHRQAGAGTL